MPRRHRPVVARQAALCLLLSVGTASAAPPAPGQVLATRASQYLQHVDRLADRPAAAGEHAVEPLAPRSSMLSSARLVEMPAETIPGQYARPKYALGFRSGAMKSLAKNMGLDAHTCLLPLVRARTTLSQSGEVGGRVMVFARCSFY